MTLPSFIMTREQYEARCRERFEEVWPSESEHVRRAMGRMYPSSLAAAAKELHERGLRTDEEHLARLARSLGLDLRVIGRNLVLYPDDIDALAETLEGMNRLTRDALWRRSEGMTCAEQLAIQRELKQRRLSNMQRAADAVGATIPDVNDLLGAGRLRDPIEWTDDDVQRAIGLLGERNGERS